jgi:dienelactone hydrolase
MKRDELQNDGPGFEQFVLYEPAAALEPARPVYWYGSGPPVIVLHEVPGATPELFRFANRIAQAGFTAFVPILFGEANHPATGLYALGQFARLCLWSEFSVLATHRSTPITGWVRELGRLVHTNLGGPGIGAVGLCITGSFALTMMLDEWMLAPVVSEPSLPFPIGKGRRASLPLADDEIAAIQARGAEILAFRFDGDTKSPQARYETITATFPLDARSNGRLTPTCPNAHAVFTSHYDDRPANCTRPALEDLIAFLRERL